jgi:crossover junction endodeoxyribonuclease RusA
MLELELPFPPSVNHYYRRVGTRTLISREGRAYREKVCAILAELGVRPLAGPIRMSIEVYPPDRRRRDLDNLQKSLWDALQKGGAYRDDSQVVRFKAVKLEPVPGGKVIVRIGRETGEINQQRDA